MSEVIATAEKKNPRWRRPWWRRFVSTNVLGAHTTFAIGKTYVDSNGQAWVVRYHEFIPAHWGTIRVYGTKCHLVSKETAT
jgi:hypothetical protein